MKAAILVILAWYLVMSAASFAQYGWDKWSATRGSWRMPEKRLRRVDWIGGWPGGLLAMRVFKHKRRKGSYMWRFWLVVAAHAAAWAAVVAAWWLMRD
ncbi:MAG: DUF1294 domain-containing protein [Phycisphaerales bacterium]